MQTNTNLSSESLYNLKTIQKYFYSLQSIFSRKYPHFLKEKKVIRNSIDTYKQLLQIMALCTL